MPSWSQNVNMLIMCIYCAQAPHCPNLPRVPNQEEVLRGILLIWRDWGQYRVTWPEVMKRTLRVSWLAPPPSLPHILMHTNIPALAVPDRKATRYLWSCIHQQHQWSTRNAVSSQIDLCPLSVYTTHFPASLLTLLPGASKTSPQSPYIFTKTGMQDRK